MIWKNLFHYEGSLTHHVSEQRPKGISTVHLTCPIEISRGTTVILQHLAVNSTVNLLIFFFSQKNTFLEALSKPQLPYILLLPYIIVYIPVKLFFAEDIL